MLFADSYFTIAKPSEGVFRDRGSKFLGFAFPVSSEGEVKQVIAGVKKDHAGANHHCYAWRLGPDKQAYRLNDDGEPSGTAGRPIYSQIQSKDLTNILVVVARYFGGTLLGVSGLINAYRSAGEDALNRAEIVERHILFKYRIFFDVADMNTIMKILKNVDANILSNDYAEHCIVTFELRKNVSEKAETQLKGVYKARLEYLN